MRRSVSSHSMGIALVLVLGQLAIMAVLVISFVYMMRLEKATSTNYIDKVVAQAAAESGIEYAFAQITNLPAGAWDKATLETLGYNENKPSMTKKIVVGSVEKELSGVVGASYVTNGDAYTVTIRDESGKVCLNDSNAPYNVANADPDDPRQGRLYKLIVAICNVLPSIADADLAHNVADLLLVDPKYSRSAYPNGSYPSLATANIALREAGLNGDQINELKEYFTIYSWQDPHVIRPTFQLPDEVKNNNMEVDTWKQFLTKEFQKEPRCPVNVNTAQKSLICALLMPLQGYYLEEGPAEAQSSNHYGWWSTGKGAPDPQQYMGRAKLTFSLEAAASGYDSIAAHLAQIIYDRIHGVENTDLLSQPDHDGDGEPDANPFETWEEFRFFLSDEISDDVFLGSNAVTVSAPQMPASVPVVPAYGVPGPWDNVNNSRGGGWNTGGKALDWWKSYYADKQRDLIFAAFNPNSLFNDLNPGSNRYLAVDKVQLTQYTTELCFEPTGGFSVLSEGVVHAPDATERARYAVRADLKVFEVFRQTTQAQFMAALNNNVDNLDQIYSNAREVPFFWAPGFQDFLPTHDNNGKYFALQSYPEPLLRGGVDRIRDSQYDGQLLPTTYEEPFHFWVWNRCHFNGVPLANALKLNWMFSVPGYNGEYELSPENEPSAEPLQSADPGSLYPDGVYSEKGRTIAYRMSGFEFNVFGAFGTARFWVKPNFHTGISTRIRKLIACGNQPSTGHARHAMPSLLYLSNPNSRKEDGLADFNLQGQYGNSYGEDWIPTRSFLGGWAWSGDNGTSVTTTVSSYAATRDYPLFEDNTDASGGIYHSFLGRQWNYLALGWDFLGLPPQTTGHPTMFLSVNGFRMDLETPKERTGFHKENPAETVQGMANKPPVIQDGWMRFGDFPPEHLYGADAIPYYADATYDEISLYPMVWYQAGGAAYEKGWPMDSMYELWRAGRFQVPDSQDVDFRTEFQSAKVNLAQELKIDDTLVLRSVSWTYYWPWNNRKEETVSGTLLPDLSADNAKGIVINSNDRDDPMGKRWGAEAAGRDPDVSWDPVSVNVLQPDGNWHVADGDRANRFTYAGGSKYTGNAAQSTYRPGDVFQYSVRLHMAEDCPVLYEAPVFDDISFVFSYATPKLLSWYPVG